MKLLSQLRRTNLLQRTFLTFLAATIAPISPVESEAAAVPWVGDLGVTETTADIMARGADYERGPREKRKRRKHLLGRRDWERLAQDPAAPDLPSSGDEPTVISAQSTSLSFTGATLSDTQAVPPDSMGAVGPSQYIVAVNGRVRSFDKNTGVADGVIDVNPDVFFSSVMTPPATNNFTSDPRIRYDRLSGRWFLIIIDVPQMSGAVPNRILIAVSAGPIITPSTVWTFFQFQHDVPTPTNKKDTGKFADYPTLGIDAQALYIGVNIFGTRGLGGFDSTTGFVIRKSSILGAGPIVATPFRDLLGNGLQGGPYTPQGVDNYDPAANEGYFIAVDSAYYGRLVLRRVSDPGGTPSISSSIQITVPATGGTINVPHLGNANGSSGNLDGLDYRLIAAHIRNGRLWTCANLAVDNNGSPSGTDTRMAIRWYELSGLGSGQTPSVVQSGTLFHPSASNDTSQRSYWMGSVMVSGQGHALMGFSLAGANERINAGYAGRLATDPLGTFRAPVIYTASSASYNPSFDPGGANGRRWGDYSYTSLDPNDDMTMWTIQEWCQANNSYAVQVVKVLAPPPATPLAVTPSSFTAGQSNVAIMLTGMPVDGSGFFDPGPGFSNRIAAAISGTGVTVNSVTYNNSTNVTLIVSSASNATPGQRGITVINPDGQSATTPSLLTINPSAQTNSPPVLAEIPDRTVTEEQLLSFTVNATDPNGDSLVFSFASVPPAGASINSTNGAFIWMPTEAQGPATNIISVKVSETGASPLSDTNTFTVFVLESNLPPVLAAIPDRVIHAGTQIVWTNSVSDPDIPENIFSFSLLSGAPAAASVNPTTGVLSWPTGDSDAGTTNALIVQVADNGSPILTHTQTANIVVLSKPFITQIRHLTNSLEITWTSISGQSYRIEKCGDLVQPVWLAAAANIPATGETTAALDLSPTNTLSFYRVRTE